MPNPLIIGLGPDQILNPTNAETTYKGAMPVAQVTMLTALQAELLAATRATTAATATATTATKKATAPTVANLPKNVTGSVTAEAYKTKTSQVIEVVGVSFTKAPGDIWLSGVNVWFSGYHGNANPVLMASGTESPFSFAADVTGETVTVTLQSLGQNGIELPLATSPTYSLALTGVAGAPPAPSIASYLTSVVNGYQFSFNQEAGLLADVVAGYNIYHATTTTFPGASGLIHTVPQNAILNGVYVFTDPWPTDVSPTAVSHYYWVTAFNTSGDESSATEAWQQAIAPPNGTPTVNLVPDSNFLLPSAYWNGANDSHLPVVVNTGYMGATSIEGGVTGVVSYRRSNAFTLLANTRYWVCARQNTLGATGNPAGWGLVDASTGTFYVDLRQNDLSHGSLVFASYTPSANVSVQMSFGTNGCTMGANGYNSIGGSEPMVCVALPGTTMPPPYVASVLDTNTGGLASGISLQSLSSGSLGLQIGDVHDRVNGAIGAAAENYLIAGGKVAWRALLGDTSGDTTTGFADAANKRFVHGAMSTPTQHDIGATAGTDGTYLNSGLLFGRHLSGAPSTDYGALADSSGYLLHGRMSAPTQAVITSGSQITSGTTLSASGTAMSTIDLSAVTGTQANLVPDSAMQFPNPYWPLAAGMSIGYGGGFGTGNTLVMNCTTPTTMAQPVSFPVNPGLPITLSANISASNMTAGYALIGLNWSGRGGTIYELDVAARAAAGRYSKTFTVPAGVSVMNLYYGQWASSGNPAGTAYINQIQVEMGSAMTAYRANALDALTAGLQHGLQVQEPGGILSPVLLGDAHARVRATIGGYSETGLDNVVDGSTYLRPQGVSSGHQLTYHGLYGDTSGDTTTAIVDAANKRFVHGAMSTPTQAVINTSSQITSGTTLSASGTAMSTIDLGAATGTQRNLVPDSDLKSVNGYWGANGTDTALSWASPVGAPAGAGFYRLGTGAPFSTYGSQASRVFNVVPGLTYTFSAFLDATYVTSGAPLWKVCQPNNSGDIAVLTWAAGENARKSISFVMPSGVTQAEVMAADVKCTVTLNTEVQFSNPQLEVGSVATAYRPNIADDLAGGLLYSGVADDNAKGWNRLSKVASDNTLHASTSLNNQGSITGSSAGGIFSYTTTTTSITVTWVAGTIYLPDGTSISIPANSTGVTFSGLTGGSTYYIEAYWDVVTSAVVAQNNGTGAASRQYLIQTLYGDQHIPLAQDWAITTSASGGGSGGGGGSGTTCPADEQVIETLERGHIPAAQVMASMHVRGADGGWKRVTAARSEPGMILTYRIGGEDISVDVDHNWLRPGGNYLRPTEDLAHWTPTRLLHPGSQVQGVSGPLTVERIGKARPGSYRRITVEPGPDGDRTFRAGRAIVHNIQPT
jgi:hypothetical protein